MTELKINVEEHIDIKRTVQKALENIEDSIADNVQYSLNKIVQEELKQHLQAEISSLIIENKEVILEEAKKAMPKIGGMIAECLIVQVNEAIIKKDSYYTKEFIKKLFNL
jgi:hypothetical protein